MFILLYNVNANSTPNTYYYYHYHYYYYYYYYYHYHYYCSSYHHYYCDPSVAWNGPALERPKTIGTGRSPEWSKRSSWERLNRLDTHRDGDIYIYIYVYVYVLLQLLIFKELLGNTFAATCTAVPLQRARERDRNGQRGKGGRLSKAAGRTGMHRQRKREKDAEQPQVGREAVGGKYSA